MKEFLSRYDVQFETRLLTDERHRRDAQSRGFRASPLTIIGPVEMQGFEPPAMLRVLKEQGVIAPDATPVRAAAKRRGLVPQVERPDLGMVQTRGARWVDEGHHRSRPA